MPVPSFLYEYTYGKINLCSLGGSLCIHGSLFWGHVIDVWEMKEYGVTESWAKLFSINQETICRFFELVPLQVVNNGEILLGYDTGVGFHLDLYDIKRGTSINLKANANRIQYAATSFVYVESLVTLNSGTYVELPEIEDPKATARKTDLDSLNSGTHVRGVDRGNSEDKGDSEEEEEEGEEGEQDEDEEEEKEENEEIAEGFLASPKSVYEARETSPQKSCETLDRYNHYVEKYMDIKRRKLDLETRKLDFKIRVQENHQENQHMSMDIV
ncbi:hypothetical protein MKW92_048467 [Papaver armeniacum]|nr:hypothetical protein MKW92_048467 [Papaver armeniacum]